MSGHWLVQRQGREDFVAEDGLRALARAGQLEAGDLVYHPLLGRWLYAREVEEVRGELSQAMTLGSLAVAPVEAAPFNDAAIASFTLGVLGVVPVLGAACGLVGLPLGWRGLRRSRVTGLTDRRFSVAGIVLAATTVLLHAVWLLWAYLS